MRSDRSTTATRTRRGLAILATAGVTVLAAPHTATAAQDEAVIWDTTGGLATVESCDGRHYLLTGPVYSDSPSTSVRLSRGADLDRLTIAVRALNLDRAIVPQLSIQAGIPTAFRRPTTVAHEISREGVETPGTSGPSFQGYLTFAFDAPVRLDPGVEYWLTLSGRAGDVRGAGGFVYWCHADARYDDLGDAGQYNLPRFPPGARWEVTDRPLALQLRGTSQADTEIPQLRSLVVQAAFDGTISDRTAASLLYSLDRAARAADAGSEQRAISYLQQFAARAQNQVKGDDDDDALRAQLVAEADKLIARYQAVDGAEAAS